MVVKLLTDWRKAVKKSDKGVKRKKKAGEVEEAREMESDDGTSGDESPNKKPKYDFEIFYAALKSEVEKTIELNQSEMVEEPSDLVHIDSLANDKSTYLDAVQKINNTIKHFQKKTLAYYINLGDILFHLKMLYITKCDKCRNKPRVDFMRCFNCSELSDTRGFFMDVKNVVFYSESRINFLISLAKLGKMYTKFKYISCQVSTIQRYLSCLKGQMLKDESFWK